VYETNELLYGILKSGDSYCANGAVEFIKELKSMIPYGIYNIIFIEQTMDSFHKKRSNI
jgi:hypothetical protein